MVAVAGPAATVAGATPAPVPSPVVAGVPASCGSSGCAKAPGPTGTSAESSRPRRRRGAAGDTRSSRLAGRAALRFVTNPPPRKLLVTMVPSLFLSMVLAVFLQGGVLASGQ